MVLAASWPRITVAWDEKTPAVAFNLFEVEAVSGFIAYWSESDEVSEGLFILTGTILLVFPT